MGPANGNYASPAPSAPPPAYDYSWLSATRLTRFQAICSQYEISDYFASRLRSLERFDVVLLCDDSGSMRTPVAAPSAFAPSVTRWDELKQSVTILASIAACMDDDGIDVHFLNRQPMLAVRDATVIGPAFEPPPSGFTPIAAALQRILQQRAVSAPTGDCKQLLVVIFTDGEPTDDHGNVNLAQLQNVLNARQTHVYTTFVACTDEDWDTSMPRVDVCDDYQSERKEILAAQGPSFHFSHGDYCVKLLLGAIDPQMDSLDEKRIVRNAANNGAPAAANSAGCCTLL